MVTMVRASLLKRNWFMAQPASRGAAERLSRADQRGVALAERNALGGPVDWCFTTEDARMKLKRRYPSIDA